MRSLERVKPRREESCWSWGEHRRPRGSLNWTWPSKWEWAEVNWVGYIAIHWVLSLSLPQLSNKAIVFIISSPSRITLHVSLCNHKKMVGHRVKLCDNDVPIW